MTDQISNAEFRAAIESLDIKAANFQVFTFWIASGLLVGLITIGVTLGIVQTQNQTMADSALLGVLIIDVLAIGALLLAYLFYLRNVGKYIYGRIRPVQFGERGFECST